MADHPYSTSLYAFSLSDPDSTIEVPEWGCFVHRRAIPGSPLYDAIGTYPAAPLSANADIAGGLRRLARHHLVSIVLVPDPYYGLGLNRARLGASFEVCRPFKTHFVVEMSKRLDISKHHRQMVRRASRVCAVELVRLADHLNAWCDLYSGLIDRRAISGTPNFSRTYFSALANVDGLRTWAAFCDDGLVAMALWLRHDTIAWLHLMAANDVGYRTGASYALVAAALEHYADTEVVNLGGNAGIVDSISDGLSFFKRGFANSTATSHLCGAVLAPREYAELTSLRSGIDYFPSYRAPRADDRPPL
jgi:hypothetical protein